MRDEFARRLAAYRPSDDVVRAMGALCATPKAVWSWATEHGGGPVTIPWLLNRDGAQLAQLAHKARTVVAESRKAQQAPRRPAFDAAEFHRANMASKAESAEMAARMDADTKERARQRTERPASPEFMRALIASAPFGNRTAPTRCSDEGRVAVAA